MMHVLANFKFNSNAVKTHFFSVAWDDVWPGDERRNGYRCSWKAIVLFIRI